jgi:hypothetical protein
LTGRAEVETLEEVKHNECGRYEGGHEFGRGGDQNSLSDADHEAVGGLEESHWELHID